MLMSLLLALAALRLPFFPVPGEDSVLKQPLFISIARLVEYFLVSFYMIYAAERMIKDKKALIFAMRCYLTTAILSSAYGLISLPIHLVTGIEYLGTTGYDNRVRGFFNEGGPFGLYLVSAVLCACILYSVKQLTRRQLFAANIVLIAAIVLSQSKAAFAAIILLSLLAVMLSKSIKIKISLSLVIVMIVTAVLSTPVIYQNLMAYVVAATDDTTGLDDVSAYGFGGRAAAAIIVPRMVAAHPLAGIGFGNYQIVRNDPNYLLGLPPLMHWDYSGAGLIVKIAELGIPLALYLSFVLLIPFRSAINLKANALIRVTAAFQLIATLQGVELHFFYPWLTSAFVIAFMYLFPGTAPERKKGMVTV
jgi:hypothetical protein